MKRFINADAFTSTGQRVLGHNMFAYCLNNPVRYLDTDGYTEQEAYDEDGLPDNGLMGDTAGGGGSSSSNSAPTSPAVSVGRVANPVSSSSGGRGRTYTSSSSGRTRAGTNAGRTSSTWACFIAGTPLLTKSGIVPIDKIKCGDYVWATNSETGETAIKQVVNTFINQANVLIYVQVNGEDIITTPEHPFYVPNNGWVDAIHLRVGDVLVLVNGRYAIVERIKHEILESPINVYNSEVEDFHTYYVGYQSILVHNVCVVNQNGVKVEVRTSNEHGLPHAHVSGNGRNTTVGLNGLPMKNHPPLSPMQKKVISNHSEEINDAIRKWFPKAY